MAAAAANTAGRCGHLAAKRDLRQVGLADEGARGGTVNRENGAVAVVLDFVDPAIAFRWLVYERRHHGDNEARGHQTRRHDLDMGNRGCEGESN